MLAFLPLPINSSIIEKIFLPDSFELLLSWREISDAHSVGRAAEESAISRVTSYRGGAYTIVNIEEEDRSHILTGFTHG